jgi:fluoroacetyl-CoA thioesterase
MKGIKNGILYEIEETVTDAMSASNIGSGLLEVFSTPSMIALMEKASFLCINPYLDDRESSVGSAVNIRHLKATAVGKAVRCESTVTEVKGKKVVFSVEVYEGAKHIGTGSHTRFIIDKQNFEASL